MPLILVPFWVLLCGCLAITARDNVRGVYMGLFSLFRKDSKYNLYKAELDKYEQVFSNQAYPKLKSDMLDHLKSTDLTDVNNEELPWETYALYGIINLTGDLLEAGNYHIYRGVLNPMGSGDHLAQLVGTLTFWLRVTGSSPVIIFFVFGIRCGSSHIERLAFQGVGKLSAASQNSSCWCALQVPRIFGLPHCKVQHHGFR